jgi:Bromodomain
VHSTYKINLTKIRENLQIYTPFITLPSRTLTDYYQVIRHPVSLKGAQKRVRGQHGRAAATWVSDFQSWDAFEEEISCIWKNAQTYNEDGSEMYLLAQDFEVCIHLFSPNHQST